MTSILKNHTVLYVEDEPSIRTNITEYLESFFGTVYVAADGAQALEMYEKYHPDAMILDINIPYIDGLSVAKEIRETDQSVHIVMLTAYTEKDKLLKATELKLSKYLIKPISPKEFKETMSLLANELSKNSSRFYHLDTYCMWDIMEEKLFINGNHKDLSGKKFALLKLLIKCKGELVTYEDIMVAAWDDSFDRDISIDSVKNQVSLLRKELPSNCIESVYGQGYRLK